MAFSSEWVLAGEAVVDMVVDAAQALLRSRPHLAGRTGYEGGV
jgi:hypothetical protein